LQKFREQRMEALKAARADEIWGAVGEITKADWVTMTHTLPAHHRSRLGILFFIARETRGINSAGSTPFLFVSCL